MTRITHAFLVTTVLAASCATEEEVQHEPAAEVFGPGLLVEESVEASVEDAAESQATGEESVALLEFLRRQDRALAELSAEELGFVDTVRLDQDYDEEELRLLSALPQLRELTIWRDGEGRKGSEGAPAPRNEDLRLLADATRLETLRIGGWSAPFTDRGVAFLTEMPTLRHLHLIQAQAITDACMSDVASLPALETLNLTYTKISDAGLAHLLASDSLKSVRYGWAAESSRWLEEFRRAHPEARFTID